MPATLLIRAGQFLAFLACLHLVGGHWAVLQSVAWAGMLADYSQAYGTEKAVAMTFDGAHPCSMCRDIQQKKDQEKKQTSAAGENEKLIKKALCPSAEISLPCPAFTRQRWLLRDASAESWREPPPQPVPLDFGKRPA